MADQEQQVTIKLPNSMSVSELVNSGLTMEQAIDEMHKRVFGANYQKGPDGKPIEIGRGSAANPTPEHKEALQLETDRKAAADPNSADIIAKAVEAGVKAGLAAATKSKPNTDETF